MGQQNKLNNGHHHHHQNSHWQHPSWPKHDPASFGNWPYWKFWAHPPTLPLWHPTHKPTHGMVHMWVAQNPVNVTFYDFLRCPKISFLVAVLVKWYLMLFNLLTALPLSSFGQEWKTPAPQVFYGRNSTECAIDHQNSSTTNITAMVTCLPLPRWGVYGST